MNDADRILANIVGWATGEPWIRAVILVGSRAHRSPPDALADIDISVFATTYEPYVQDDQWLSNIGNVWVYVSDPYTRHGEVVPTRLVIFEGGIKVDFSFFGRHVLSGLAHTDELAGGYRVLLDKDGATQNLQKPTSDFARQRNPTATEFAGLVSEFYFEAYHVAKYLKRGELWLVKSRDWGLKELLLRMIEWHEQAKHQWDYNTYYTGKHMRAWVDPVTWQALHQTFAHFDGADSWRALQETTALFRQLAIETAQVLGYTYPENVDRPITAFIAKLSEP